MTTLSTGAELAAVADGMGGYAAGEVASRRALEVLRASLEAGCELADGIRAANAAVYHEASRSKAHHGMGTTLVALLRRGAEYILVNVGDSRAYRVDGGGIQQLTRDHSFVADAIRTGQLSAEDAEKSLWRNAVTRAVGTQAELEVDGYGPFSAVEPHAVLLCTDGLYRAVPDADLQQVIMDTAVPEDAVRELATAAYHAGSDDNISAIVLRFGPEAGSGPARPTRVDTAAAIVPLHEDGRGITTTTAAQPLAEPAGPRRRPDRQRAHRARPLRWTLLEIVLIFLGVSVLAYAVLRILAS